MGSVKTISSIRHDFDSPLVWGTLGEIGRLIKEQEDTLRNVLIAEAVAKAEEMLEEELNKIKKFVTENFVERDIFRDSSTTLMHISFVTKTSFLNCHPIRSLR